MALDRETVAQVAQLARLRLDETESAAITDRLNEILGMVDELQQAEVTDVEPMAHPLELTQPLRADEVTEIDHRNEVMALAPAEEGGCYLVPRVVE